MVRREMASPAYQNLNLRFNTLVSPKDNILMGGGVPVDSDAHVVNSLILRSTRLVSST
jgi:hypothetical protein